MVLDAIEQAIWTRQREGVLDLKDVVHHTDRGSQYTSIRFTERLAEAGIQPSVGAVGSSYDNALAETINGLYKTELIKPRKPWRTIEEVELRHRRMGRLVQPPPPLRILRRHPTRRAGGGPLRSTPETSRRLSSHTRKSPDPSCHPGVAPVGSGTLGVGARDGVLMLPATVATRCRSCSRRRVPTTTKRLAPPVRSADRPLEPSVHTGAGLRQQVTNAGPRTALEETLLSNSNNLLRP